MDALTEISIADRIPFVSGPMAKYQRAAEEDGLKSSPASDRNFIYYITLHLQRLISMPHP